MTLRLVQIAMNARDDSAVGRFWAEALGWGVSSEGPGVTNVEPVGVTYPDPATVCIDVIVVPEPKTVKNRVHIDLATTSADHQADLVARLLDLGATHADVGQGDVPWTVLADVEGNEFCVLAPAPVYEGTGPIAAVVVGGTSFIGGVGSIPGTLLGAVIIGILDKGLNQAGVHFSLQSIVKGSVILAAVYFDVRRGRAAR